MRGRLGKMCGQSGNGGRNKVRGSCGLGSSHRVLVVVWTYSAVMLEEPGTFWRCWYRKGMWTGGVHKSLCWDGGDEIWARIGCWGSIGLVARPAWGPAGGDRRVWWGSARVPHGPPWA